MIYGFSYEEHEPKKVELDWIRHNSERVQHLLDGINTRDGELGSGAVEQIFLANNNSF